jgi:tetratricopeptide (TPR) repeat protein
MSRIGDGGGHPCTLWVAQNYAYLGNYDRAIEIGEAEDEEDHGCNKSGIRGYVADVMFKHDKKEEADKLLNETVQAVESGKMALHRDFIVSLVLHGKTDTAVRLSTTIPVVDQFSWSGRDPVQSDYKRYPAIILRVLLMNDREAEAMKVIDEWKDPRGKAWAIWKLCRWNQEEHLDKKKPSLFTPELKTRWSDFLAKHADTLDAPLAIMRAEEWNSMAECLLEFGAKAAAAKVLDKVLGILKDVMPFTNEQRELNIYAGWDGKHGHIPILTQTGALLLKAGESDKADIAFVAAVQACAEYKPGLFSENLRKVLDKYTACKGVISPEQIRIAPDGGRNIYSDGLRYRWDRDLFMGVPIV